MNTFMEISWEGRLLRYYFQLFDHLNRNEHSVMLYLLELDLQRKIHWEFPLLDHVNHVITKAACSSWSSSSA